MRHIEDAEGSIVPAVGEELKKIVLGVRNLQRNSVLEGYESWRMGRGAPMIFFCCLYCSL